MAANERIDRLRRQVARQSLGPVAVVSDRGLDSLVAALRSLAAWLRQSAQERPLITLLLAVEAGYAVGRMGGRNARR
jgi:thymidylate kinase